MPSTFSPVLPPELWPLGQRDQAADSAPNDDSSLISLTKGMLNRLAGGASVKPIGCVASASFMPTATAYGAGAIIDVAKEFAFTYADGTAVPPGSLIRVTETIVKIDATALQSGEGAYTLQPYSVTPPSAQADHATWALASADLAAYSGAIGLYTPVDLGEALYVKTTDVSTSIKLTTSSLWGRLVTVPGFTPTAVARQVLLRGFVV